VQAVNDLPKAQASLRDEFAGVARDNGHRVQSPRRRVVGTFAPAGRLHVGRSFTACATTVIAIARVLTRFVHRRRLGAWHPGRPPLTGAGHGLCNDGYRYRPGIDAVCSSPWSRRLTPCALAANQGRARAWPASISNNPGRDRRARRLAPVALQPPTGPGSSWRCSAPNVPRHGTR
jgi:hypothetical protein